MTVKEMLQLISEADGKINLYMRYANIKIYYDGSGSLMYGDVSLVEWDNLDEMVEEINKYLQSE